jgi:mycothiol synthase
MIHSRQTAGGPGGGILKLRRFIPETDEEDWVRVWNVVHGVQLDLAPMTVDEMKAREQSPDFDSASMFIAELDGQPVGIVQAHADKFSDVKKGFVRDLGVVPRGRGHGIEEALAEAALAELKARGMTLAQSSAYSDQPDLVRLWERLGFRPVRRFSLMACDLGDLPSSVGKGADVALRPLRRDADEDLVTLNRLENACFQDLFDWQPSPLEQTVYAVRDDPGCTVQAWFFALVNGMPMGYVGMGIDASFNRKKGAKCGWVLGLGVLQSHRRRGIGMTLMLRGLHTVKAQGMTVAMLGVDDGNVTNAIRLYEKLGFHVARKEVAYETPLELP